MIESFRKYANSWVVRFFFLLLALCFAFLWGGHEAWKMIGFSRESTVATVGGHRISVQDLGHEINRELIRIQLETGKTYTEEQVREVGLDRHVLQRMVIERLIELEANKLGIVVTDNFAAQAIKSSPLFKTSDGMFSKARFDQIVHHLGFQGEKDYVPYIKRELLRFRIVRALTDNMPVPDVYLNKLYAWDEQTRSIQVMIINPKQLQLSGEPTENELRDFYGKNQKLFWAPEKRNLQLLLIDGSRFKDAAKVKPEDVDALYEAHKGDKYKSVTPQKAKTEIKAQLEHDKIAEAAQEFAHKLEEEFNSGVSLKELALKHYLTYREIKDASRQGLTPDSPDATYILRAFENEEGVLSSLEKDTQGKFFLTYVESITPSKQQSFKNALPQVKQKYTENKQLEAAQKLAHSIGEELNKGGFFEAIAHQNNLKLVTVKVNRRNVLPGSPLVLVPQMIHAIFSINKGQSTILPYVTPGQEVQILVTKLTDIKNADPSKVSKEDMKKFEEEIQLQMQGDLIDQYLEYLRGKYKVEINQHFFKGSNPQNNLSEE
jgi:peptidyl-prolyl cis-trans isomerase D